MNDDDRKGSGVPTVPPPSGEEDLYSANTVVGEASADLLAIVRAAEEGTLAKAASKAPAAPPSKGPAAISDDEKLEELKRAASRAAQAAADSEIARQKKETGKHAPVAAAPAKSTPAPAAAAPVAPAPTAAAPPPAAPPVPAKVPAPAAAPAPAKAPAPAAAPEILRTSEPLLPQDETSKRPALKMADDPRPPGGLPPAVAILIVFAAAALALTAIVR